MNSVLSLVEITAFRLESKSCKGFFLDKFSTIESTRIYNRSFELQPGFYLQIPTENHQRPLKSNYTQRKTILKLVCT